MKETWDVLERVSKVIVRCQCKLCGEVFVADSYDRENVKEHWHPKSQSYCYMPQCPKGCRQAALEE